ncbi:ankyrin repeat domain-containing protein [Skeletonema marinoi]|uniref:Ankyrin repeat domain-containing protein n=1 Tax=Skeletonema marinoi TaxID=267567 RepID=A0AAD9D471_9STRA|nr:ankyrin repeat domain-containing protein [Skeletonema marinoi]
MNDTQRNIANIIQLLIDAAPDSVRSETNIGELPLHFLCRRKALDEMAAIQTLKLFLKKYPAAVRHVSRRGLLPIHMAAMSNSPEFCRVLIEAYPGSERISNVDDELPLHFASRSNSVAAVEYLHKLYPDAISHATSRGAYPVHAAITEIVHRRDNPIAAVDIVKFMLDCNPNVKLQKMERKSLLHFACNGVYNGSNFHAGTEMIQTIYDAHPEAIEENCISSDRYNYQPPVRAFINRQLVYARQAKDHRLMTTPDSNGQLPLHTALQNNVRLGSIKLLLKGNPSALRTLENNFSLPLHIACEYHESADVIQYLVGLDAPTLDAVDRDGNTALHLACRSGSYEIIALILDKYDAVSVSKQNVKKKLPIHLLWESSDRAVLDRESIEYTESVFRLLRAYPESLMNIDEQKQSCPRQSGKKRKFGKQE